MTKEEQIKMFGCETAAIDEAMNRYNGQETMMLAMSILSDAQHVMAHGDDETARQFINRAKYVISKDKSRYQPHPARVNPCDKCGTHIAGTIKLDDGTILQEKEWRGQ